MHAQTMREGSTSRVDDEVYSVRMLDSWEPCSSQGPPTQRLYLDFNKLPGRENEFKTKHGKIQCKSSDEQHAPPVRKETRRNDNSSLQDVDFIQYKDNKYTPKHRFETKTSQRKRSSASNAVIVPEIKRSENLKTSQKQRLTVQLKVLDKLNERCSSNDDAANSLFKLFRSCNPDEFGFVKRESFRNVVAPHFELNPHESDTLFNIGDSKNQGEVNYHQFREAFKRIDRKTHHLERPRRILKHVPGLSRNPEFKTEQGRLSSMSHEEKNEFRLRNRINKALEHNRSKMMEKFKKRHELDNSNKQVHIRTKLNYKEASKILEDFGVQIEPDILAKYYQEGNGDKGITFSQLASRTNEYFAMLEGRTKPPTPVRNMELKGQFLGCRKGKQKLTGVNIFGIDLPSDTMEHHKSRWTTKTLDEKRKVSYGGNKARTLVSEKMLRGNGNFLVWPEDESIRCYRNSIIGTGRSTLGTSNSMMETGRSIVETSRSKVLGTNRSASSILSTPYAID